jgi:hypothetical protein
MRDSSYTEVRGEFWNFYFGTSKEIVETSLKNNSINCYIDNLGTLSTDQLMFGGYGFSYSSFYFVNNKFFEVIFVARFVNKNDAISRYNEILSSLKNSYGNPSKKYNVGCSFWGKENTCSIESEKLEANDGNLYYYVRLSYWNESLYNEYNKENKL